MHGRRQLCKWKSKSVGWGPCVGQDTLEIFCGFASEKMVEHLKALLSALPSPLSFLMSVGAAPAGSLPQPHPNRVQVRPPTCAPACEGHHWCHWCPCGIRHSSGHADFPASPPLQWLIWFSQKSVVFSTAFGYKRRDHPVYPLEREQP